MSSGTFKIISRRMKPGIIILMEAMSPMFHNDNVRSNSFVCLDFIQTDRMETVNLTYEKLK